MPVRTRLERLERQLPPPSPPTREDRQEQRRWGRLVHRLFSLLSQVEPLLNEAEQPLVNEALEAYVTDQSGALSHWLRDLREGRCRLPELSPETMKQVLLSFFHPACGDPMVCNQCGLECARYDDHLMGRHFDPPDPEHWAQMARDYGWRRSFEQCPGCGAFRDYTWPHLTVGMDLPWKALDGWMGR
jgi:hypothetical protein